MKYDIDSKFIIDCILKYDYDTTDKWVVVYMNPGRLVVNVINKSSSMLRKYDDDGCVYA